MTPCPICGTPLEAVRETNPRRTALAGWDRHCPKCNLEFNLQPVVAQEAYDPYEDDRVGVRI